MIKKVIIAIIAGFFYWMLNYAVMKLFSSLHYEYSDYIGKVIYYVVPFLLGAALIIVLKESAYVGMVYSGMIVIVSYLLTLIELVLRLPEGRNPIEETLWLFNLLGIRQIVITMFGGLLAVLINKWRIKSANSVRST